MVSIKDEKKYYTREEAKKISRTQMEKNAKKFAQEVIAEQEEITSRNEAYV